MRENEKGFTLVEVLGVLIILSIIVVITVPLVQDKIAESRENSPEFDSFEIETLTNLDKI